MTMLAMINASQSLSSLLAGFEIGQPVPEVMVNDIVMDSRQVTPGAVFVAGSGARSHGLQYAEQACARGASVILWEPDDRHPKAAALVPNMPESLPAALPVPALSRLAGDMAARLYDDPSRQLFTVGVTGTDGKTSCAWLIARAMTALHTPCGYLGTLGFGAVQSLEQPTHTTPDSVRLQRWLACLVAAQHQAVALEVSSHALAQQRTDAVNFDVAVLTGIGRDHLDYHGSEAAYIAAKRRLFDSRGLRFAVLNADDEIGQKWLACAESFMPVACGRTKAVRAYSYHVHVASLQTGPEGLTTTLVTHQGQCRVKSRLVGAFNASNLASTLAVLLIRGVPLTTAAEVLENLPTVPGRMERVDWRRDQPLVIVDYAHTPGALEAVLKALVEHAKGSVSCVFGCGGDRDRGKRAPMGAIAARYAARLWLTDDNPRHETPTAIVAQILAGIPDARRQSDTCRVEHDRATAIAAALARAGSADVVLIAGKGHETTQQYGEVAVPFDDRDIARQALEAQ